METIRHGVRFVARWLLAAGVVGAGVWAVEEVAG
jgi:hypothetical protein